MERRTFLKGLAAFLASSAVPVHLNVAAKALTDEPVLIDTPPSLQTLGHDEKHLFLSASPVDIINAVAQIPHDPARYGFSYHKLFEIVKIYPGEAPIFPLDLLTPGSLEDFPPAVILDKDKNVAEALRSKHDYIALEWSDFTGQPVELSKRSIYDARWDAVSRWLQEVQHNFQAELAKKAWEVLLKSTEVCNVVVKTEDDWEEDLTRKIAVAKVFMRRIYGNSTSLRRGQLTDVFVPTQTYKKVKEYLEDKWEQEALENRSIQHIGFNHCLELYNTAGPQLTVYGVRFNHAPELSWFDNESDFAIGADLQTSDSNLIVVKDDPMMFHKDLGTRIEAFAWQDCGIGVLDPRKLVMIQ